MKKITILLALLISKSCLNAQISLQNTYAGNYNIVLVKLQNSGYKYVKYNKGSILELYNINHSLFKSISVPTVNIAGSIMGANYVSETLFDTDNLIEYSIITNGSPSLIPYHTYIFKENGTLLLQRDSAILAGPSDNGVFFNQDGIYSDGANTKMKLAIYGSNNIVKTEIYTLPGTIPCVVCSASGTVTGIASPGNPATNNPVFYPNPVTDQLKLKYELPTDYKNAEIKIYDLQGKLIETFKVTNTFDFIYLPSDYNNALYFYALNVDGKTIKTEKILLNK